MKNFSVCFTKHLGATLTTLDSLTETGSLITMANHGVCHLSTKVKPHMRHMLPCAILPQTECFLSVCCAKQPDMTPYLHL